MIKVRLNFVILTINFTCFLSNDFHRPLNLYAPFYGNSLLDYTKPSITDLLSKDVGAYLLTLGIRLNRLCTAIVETVQKLSFFGQQFKLSCRQKPGY